MRLKKMTSIGTISRDIIRQIERQLDAAVCNFDDRMSAIIGAGYRPDSEMRSPTRLLGEEIDGESVHAGSPGAASGGTTDGDSA